MKAIQSFLSLLLATTVVNAQPNRVDELLQLLDSVTLVSIHLQNANEFILYDSTSGTAIPFVKIWEKENQFRQDQFPSFISSRLSSNPIQAEWQIRRTPVATDWKFYLVISMLALILVFKMAYGKELSETALAIKQWQPSKQLYRELSLGISAGTVLLNAFSLVSISVYVFGVLEFFKLKIIQPDSLLLSFVVTTLFALISIRYLLFKLISYLIRQSREIDLFLYFEFQLFRLLGIALLPFIVLIFFLPTEFTWISITASAGLTAAIIMARYVKGFNIGMSYFLSHKFHLFLYICALEISPAFLLIRYLNQVEAWRLMF